MANLITRQHTLQMKMHIYKFTTVENANTVIKHLIRIALTLPVVKVDNFGLKTLLNNE